MNIAAEKKKLDEALDEYRRRLDLIPEEQFTATPPGGGWSYAEVYSHIMQSDLAVSVLMQRCLQGNHKTAGKKPNLLGRVVLTLGSFPPWKRYRQPAEVAARIPAKKIDKEEARNLMIKCRKRLTELLPQLHHDPYGSTQPHPLMGHFTGTQWFKYIRIHTEHHLKQLNRIAKSFSRQGNNG